MPAGFSLRNDREKKNLDGIPIKILAGGSGLSVSQKTTNSNSEECSAVSQIDNATEDQESDESTLIIVD